MARESTITQEQVNAAAERIRAGGQKPTNRLVLEALGTGSMATIVKFMQAWKAGQATKSADAGDVLIDPEVSRSISAMIVRRIGDATSEANGRIAELQSDLATVIAENERQAAELESQALEVERLKALTQSQEGKIEQMNAAHSQLAQQLAAESKAREQAQVELGKAQLRIESLPGLQEELRVTRELAQRNGEEAAELRGKMASALRTPRRKTSFGPKKTS